MKLTDKFQMENNLKHIFYGIFASLALIAFAGCSRRIDYTDGEPVKFSDLPKRGSGHSYLVGGTYNYFD